MRTETLLARIAVISAISLMFVQPLFSQALPVSGNRPERGVASWTAPWVPTASPGPPASLPPQPPPPASHDSSDLPPYLLGTTPNGTAMGSPSGDPDRITGPTAAGLAAPSGLAATEVGGPPLAFAIAPPPAAIVPPNDSETLPPRQGIAGPEVFAINVPMNRHIKEYLDVYTAPAGLNWLKIVLRRAEPFLGYIASRIQHFHVPPALLYLPIVESTYNTYAVSQSGAAGLWQFMSNSVYPFGLKMNEWMDERFDFWESTDASLQKLKYNYDQLGNWLLALAAYNAGLNYVEAVVRQTGIHNVWELGAKGYLPYETMVYIPKFLAIAAVCSYPGRYGLPLSWQPPLEWTRIKLHQAVDLRILARDAGINESLLLEGNAELRYDITPPGNSGYYLKVPKRDSKVVEQVLREREFHLMRFYIYTVESGDTLYDLSLYYGVPVSMILQYNPTVSAHYLQIGQRLVIPGIKDVPPYRHGWAANLPNPGPKITLHDPTGRFTGLYTVRPGDTLWGISQRYGITPAELARVNGITETTIITDGTVLHVPGPGALIIEGAN